MNILKKAYCRTFQFVFKIAIPFMPYRKPQILKNFDAVADKLNEKKLPSVLLVTDSFLKTTEPFKELEDVLKCNGIKVAVYGETRANPTVENVESARKVYLDNDCQAIIAYGGGSSIDCAKAVGARIVYPKKSLFKLKGLLKVIKKIPTLFAIPTTAGTGSEVTVTAVITDTERKYKYTMNNFTFIPSFAVLNPKVTFSLPKHITSTTGMDALTHAVEAYIGRSTTKETRNLALKATKLVFENVRVCFDNPTDFNARKNMLYASHYAGLAFTKSYVGYIHGIAHSLGGRYNTPHGLANAVVMPYILRAYGKSAWKKLSELAKFAGVADSSDSDEVASNKFISAIEELNKSMGIPATINEITEEDIPEMAKHAEKEANPLYPVPKLFTSTELQAFYRAIGGLSNNL